MNSIICSFRARKSKTFPAHRRPSAIAARGMLDIRESCKLPIELQRSITEATNLLDATNVGCEPADDNVASIKQVE